MPLCSYQRPLRPDELQNNRLVGCFEGGHMASVGMANTQHDATCELTVA